MGIKWAYFPNDGHNDDKKEIRCVYKYHNEVVYEDLDIYHLDIFHDEIIVI